MSPVAPPLQVLTSTVLVATLLDEGGRRFGTNPYPLIHAGLTNDELGLCGYSMVPIQGHYLFLMGRQSTTRGWIPYREVDRYATYKVHFGWPTPRYVEF